MLKFNHMPSRKTAFTLIELLVVISILAILMGFIIPVFFSTKDKGNMARAKAEAKQLETAWKQFFITYNRWPQNVASAPVEMKGEIVEELGGITAGSVNKQRISFFDVPHDTNSVYRIADPWMENNYKELFDHDMNNRIDLPDEVGGGQIFRSVLVYTIFVSKDDNKTNIIKSWD